MVYFLFRHIVLVFAILILFVATYVHFGGGVREKYSRFEAASLITLPNFLVSTSTNSKKIKVPLTLDIDAYNKKVYEIANNPLSYASSTEPKYSTTTSKYLWPVKTVYPKVGAILPFNRIVAYYGN